MTLEINHINQQIAEVKSLYLLKAELAAEIDKIETSLKEQLQENNQELVVTENGTVSYKEVISKTFNVTALKKSADFSFIFDKFAVSKSTMRFKVA